MSVTSVILGNEPSTQIGWHSLCILEQNVHGKCDTSANKMKMYWHSLDSYFFNDPSCWSTWDRVRHTCWSTWDRVRHTCWSTWGRRPLDDSSSNRDKESMADGCNKLFPESRRQTAGLWLLTCCCPQKKIYGFKKMITGLIIILCSSHFPLTWLCYLIFITNLNFLFSILF